MKFQKILPAVVAGSLFAAAPFGVAQVKIGLSAPLSGSQVAVKQLAVALPEHADAYHAQCVAK